MQSKLYALRKSRNLSQEDVAKILGISRVSYGNKERGDNAFTIDEMFELASVFNLSIAEIFLPRGNQNGYNKEQEV